MKSFELFTGAGGLAMGVAAAGFEHLGVVEWNRDACASLRANAKRIPAMSGWPIIEADVRDIDFRQWAGEVDLLAAGAPCQPFSLGGKHLGDADRRNMFPEIFRAAREMQPAMIVVENVKGLLRRSFAEYFRYIELQLCFPELTPKRGEGWQQHASRLEKAVHSPPRDALRYVVRHQLLNAANFGVPQRRERVFITAFRSDLDAEWTGLQATHTEDSLLYAQYVSGSYWEEHGISRGDVPERLRRRVERLAKQGPHLFEDRWQTVADALRGLPEPVDGKPHRKWHGHIGQPGARSYPGHTGSPLHEPAKTLKAGAHGVPGGENMLRRPDGSVRYFTVRESARLQTFPDEYQLQGAWGEAMRQLGNAVPVKLAREVAVEMRRIYQLALAAPEPVAQVA